MPKPLEVKPLPNFRLWFRYDDGVSGEVDLSDLAGKGVFKAWDQPDVLGGVRIGPLREISWNGKIDLCPDSLFMKLPKKHPRICFPI